MMPWFTWNNQNSSANGLWISKLPKITRAPERVETVTIPGRAGALTLVQGEDVYDEYTKDITVTTVNNNALLQKILDWLRGEGNLVVSTEPERVYHGRIANEVSFERVGNNLLIAKITFQVKPFKTALHPNLDRITFDGDGTIYNRGNVASRPIVSITASGTKTVSIGGTAMTFTDLSGTVVVDCGAGIITKSGALWTNHVSGDFWKIPVGESAVTVPASTTVVIDPEWRWV